MTLRFFDICLGPVQSVRLGRGVSGPRSTPLALLKVRLNLLPRIRPDMRI
jgi:hypothetical protein